MRRLLSISILSAFIAGCSQSGSSDTAGNAVQPAKQRASTDTTPNTVNQVCPIMYGKVASDGGTTDWNGKLIGFCCPGCEPKWEKLSEDDKSEKLAAAAEKAKEGAAYSKDEQP